MFITLYVYIYTYEIVEGEMSPRTVIIKLEAISDDFDSSGREKPRRTPHRNLFESTLEKTLNFSYQGARLVHDRTKRPCRLNRHLHRHLISL